MDATHRVQGYNGGAMALHWAIAVAILFQLGVGFAMARQGLLPDGLRFILFQWHKTVGILILALTLARIAWRLMNPPPPGVPQPRHERLLAGAVHLAFYGLMLAVPLTGWLLVSASPTGIPTLLFLSERLVWPNLPVAADAGTASLAHGAHVWLAYSFLGLLALHVAGAIKHAWIDRAPSFSRMLPAQGLARPPAARGAGAVACLAIALFLGSGLAIPYLAGQPATASAPGEPEGTAGAGGWTLDPAASRLGYEVAFSGKTVTGEIGQWTATIAFDPERLEEASARVMIEAGSITISDSFIGSNLGGEDGLQLAAHPRAEVLLDRFERNGEDFVARGHLTLRGLSAPIEVPFSFRTDESGRAYVEGHALFDRLAYGLGAQNDASGEWLGKTVQVVFTLQALPAAP